MLSDLQTKKLTRYFEVYDVDDDGKIGSADFERVLENVRVVRGASETSAAYGGLRAAYLEFWGSLSRSADVDADGGVDLDEWLAYWQLLLEDDRRYAAEVTAITDHLFTIFDTDEDGQIGPDEFGDFYGVLGLGQNLARSVFIELDADRDGALSREELLDVSAQFYRSEDPGAVGNLLFGPYGV